MGLNYGTGIYLYNIYTFIYCNRRSLYLSGNYTVYTTIQCINGDGLTVELETNYVL